MRAFQVLFCVGVDRPGIVKEVTAYLKDSGANVEDSRMAVMGGRFTITCLFSAEKARMEAIQTNTGVLEKAGLSLSFHEAADPQSKEKAKGDCLPMAFKVRAMDHTGLVNEVVSILHDAGVNIEELDTDVNHAPFHATPLYDMKIKAKVPAARSVIRIKNALIDLAALKNLDIIFE